MMVTKPMSFMGSKEKRPTWKTPIARVVAALKRRSSTSEDSSNSCVSQSTVKTELVIESPIKNSKACVEVVEVESIPASPRKSKDDKKERSKKSKKSGKKEGDGDATSSSKTKKVRKSLNPTDTDVTTDLDPVREETGDIETKKASTTTKTKKKKSTEGDKKTKKSKKTKEVTTDDSKDKETATMKKKKKKKKSSTKTKKREMEQVCTDVEKVERHDEEDTSVCSCATADRHATSEPRKEHDLTRDPAGVSTRTEDSSIHSTESFLRASVRSRQSASERPSPTSMRSHMARDNGSLSPPKGDTKPSSFGTLDEFFQCHQQLVDPLDTENPRKLRSYDEGCGSLDLDDVFQISSCNETTTKSTTSSTEKTQGSSSHHRRLKLASPGRKVGRRTTQIADWTAPVDASLHWSSCHEKSSLDFLNAPENSMHGSSSITHTTVSKTSTKLNSMDSSHRITIRSDHDISTCDGDEFGEDMFDSDTEDECSSHDETKESPSVSLGRKTACRTISETSFDSTCMEEVHAAFEEEGGDAFSDGNDKTRQATASTDCEFFEILQMTPRTRTKVLLSKRKKAVLADADKLTPSSWH